MGAEHGAQLLNRTLIGWSFRLSVRKERRIGGLQLFISVLYQKAFY